MAKAKNTSVELALTLVRKAHAISLPAGLALALSDGLDGLGSGHAK